MSTSNQQHQHLQRGGRRQPFGFLHANTLSSASATGSVAIAGNDSGDGAVSAHSSDPVKNESKKKFRGVLTSIVSRRTRGRNTERSSRSSSSGRDLMESPTKKTRVMTEEDQKPNADATTTTDAAVLPREDTEADNLCHNDFAPSDVADIFRQGGVWDDDMEDMLSLKQANPISDDRTGDEGCTNDNEEERADPSRSLARELDENASGEPILSHNRLTRSEDGFKIYTEK